MWSYARPELVRSRGGDTTRLTVDCGWTFSGYCDATLDLSVPRGTAVELHSFSGNVVARDLHADATLTTHSGQVTATDVTSDVTAHSSSGRLTVADTTGDLDLRVDSGDIEVTGTRTRTSPPPRRARSAPT